MTSWKSFGNAFRGLVNAIREEAHMRIHMSALVLAIGTGFYFHISSNEWFAVIGCSAAVISMELVNTAIERLTDLVSPQTHPLAGQAKDIAAGAVLVVAIAALATGLIIFLPYFAKLY